MTDDQTTQPNQKPGGDKYITFHRDDWIKWISDVRSGTEIPGPETEIPGLYEIEDAVVFRGQDVFAPSLFWQYAHTITTHTELIASYAMDDEGNVSPEAALVIADLASKADLFADIAAWAENLEMRKIPD